MPLIWLLDWLWAFHSKMWRLWPQRSETVWKRSHTLRHHCFLNCYPWRLRQTWVFKIRLAFISWQTTSWSALGSVDTFQKSPRIWPEMSLSLWQELFRLHATTPSQSLWENLLRTKVSCGTWHIIHVKLLVRVSFQISLFWRASVWKRLTNPELGQIQ